MKKLVLTLLVTIPLLLVSCVGSAGTTVEPTETPTIAIPPTKTVEILPTATSTTAPVKISLSDCTLVSSLPEPPTELVELFSINEDDWAIGPEDAAVTLIEYGDFQ